MADLLIAGESACLRTAPRIVPIPPPAPIDSRLIRELSTKRVGREISDPDATAVANLLNGLEADMQAFRKVPIADGEESATTYSAVEGEP